MCSLSRRAQLPAILACGLMDATVSRQPHQREGRHGNQTRGHSAGNAGGGAPASVPDAASAERDRAQHTSGEMNATQVCSRLQPFSPAAAPVVQSTMPNP
jgi:hypothetical protein